jgi:hypothetical protein
MVLEQVRALEARDPDGKALAYAQMSRFPGHLVAELEQTNGHAADRAFIGA